MIVGGKYNWKGQHERLVYLGRNWSGNGYWHQFEKVDEPGVVWCEVLDDQLASFEETVPETRVIGTSPLRFAARSETPTQKEDRERADWNAAVDRRKAEKKASKA